MKFLIEVITTGFKFSSPKCGTEQLKIWGEGKRGLRTHVVCIKNQCKSGRCGKGDFLCYRTAEIVLPHPPSIHSKLRCWPFLTPCRDGAPYLTHCSFLEASINSWLLRELILGIMSSLVVSFLLYLMSLAGTYL